MHLDSTRRTPMPVTVKPLPNGPLQVKGEVEVLDAQGNPLPLKSGDIFLCRCGQSANKPFCDGTHKRVGFKS
jgi:CDGSH-type Zn-finger protein